MVEPGGRHNPAQMLTGVVTEQMSSCLCLGFPVVQLVRVELRRHGQAGLRQSHEPQRCPYRPGAVACSVRALQRGRSTLEFEDEMAARVHAATGRAVTPRST